ncbi:MAG: MarR family transcriptional regulator [Eubacteriales bacterium]|nr:MarR family transcriptional regulator [Eubacteriales bacterium]
MDSFERINNVLVHLFRDILSLEEKAMAASEFSDLSMNDWHVIEAIGPEAKKNMSQIARELSVTLGSLTSAMNGLHNKGYVERRHSTSDRRVVNISLTDRGVAAFEEHAQFHKKMIDAIIRDQTPEELSVLVRSLSKLTDFFMSYKA